MLKLTIQPHIGVGPIRLGMMRNETRDIMLVSLATGIVARRLGLLLRQEYPSRV